jgi:hydrogenase nickel incorporation protein HypA/HybF
MHEFSLVLNIIDIVTEYAVKENAKEVKEVEIEVGELSGVVIDALEFALQTAVKGTLMEHSVVHIQFVKGLARCHECLHEYETQSLFKPCPKCHTCAPDIVRGKELRVKSIVIE